MARKIRKPGWGQRRPRWKILVAMGSALLVGAAGIVTYRATGGYRAEQLLPAPAILTGEAGLQELGASRLPRCFIFDHVLLLSNDSTPEPVVLSPAAYAGFYRCLDGEKSLRGNKQELGAAFEVPGVVDLLLVMRPHGSCASSFAREIVQRVQVAPKSGMVRVEIPAVKEGWAYFQAAGIERHLR
jgi:hypothetical protein